MPAGAIVGQRAMAGHLVPGPVIGLNDVTCSCARATGHKNTSSAVILVTYGQVATPALLGLTFRCAGAMLPCNRENNSGVQLTSGVSLDYTTNLRCTLTSSAICRSLDPHSGIAAGRPVRAVTVGFKLGRTPVGSLAQRLS
jgi:hypothetical protein